MEGDNAESTSIGMGEPIIPDSVPQNPSSSDQSITNSSAPQAPETDDTNGTRVNDVAAASTQAEKGGVAAGDAESSKPISKNQLKKLKRQAEFEERREDRKRIRKEKKQEFRAKKRAEREEKVAAAKAAGLDPEEVLKAEKQAEKPRKFTPNPAPITFILDCDFEKYMLDTEIVSLSSQVVRSYSQNRIAKHQAHLFVSSFGGKMKTRFETVLGNSHKHWNGAYFLEEDFRTAAKQASELMAGPKGGEMYDVLRTDGDQPALAAPVRDPADPTPIPEPEPEDVDKSIVYLTSESPYTLEKLEPYTSYVIGGLVDRNREKGLCYKRAREMKVRTAKLPIGEYMAMQSRFVLTTNQVVEIMAKWLECGDWGEAFLGVIPKRKGGVLKGHSPEGQGSEADANGDQAPQDGQEDKVDINVVQEGAETVATDEPGNP